MDLLISCMCNSIKKISTDVKLFMITIRQVYLMLPEICHLVFKGVTLIIK